MEMKSDVELRFWSMDSDKIEEADLKDGLSLCVWSVPEELQYETNMGLKVDTIFHVWIEYGEHKDKIISADIGIDQLELFAHSILSQIDIIRKNYNKEINKQMGYGAAE